MKGSGLKLYTTSFKSYDFEMGWVQNPAYKWPDPFLLSTSYKLTEGRTYRVRSEDQPSDERDYSGYR